MNVRALIFSPVSELSVRSTAYSLYDIPSAITNAIPDGALIVNRAGRTYNFPLLGPKLTWRVLEYTPEWSADLRADFLFYRGLRADLHNDPSWISVYQGQPANRQWWDYHDGEIIALYRLH
jgi:hypothetical protein